jgi:predicted small lipoprotein YifL
MKNHVPPCRDARNVTIVRPAFVTLALLLALCASLASCGRKGDLDPPGLAVTDPGQPQPPKQPTANKPFLLDPLL